MTPMGTAGRPYRAENLANGRNHPGRTVTWKVGLEQSSGSTAASRPFVYGHEQVDLVPVLSVKGENHVRSLLCAVAQQKAMGMPMALRLPCRALGKQK
jgi:hypothetical protein